MNLEALTIRKFTKEDAHTVSDLIIHTLRTTNIKDEPKEDIESYILDITPQAMIDKAKQTHFYVFEQGGIIIATGAIGPYQGNQTEACFYSIFVLPTYQQFGIGRLIMDTLEDDPYFHHAKRIIVPASITAVQFYRKRGYDYINGNQEPDFEGLVYLEKLKQSNKSEHSN